MSIAIPSYNVENTLSATLESVCVESLLEVLDVLVIDDGSTDHTAEIAEEYVRKFPGTVRLFHKENGGHGSSVNMGISNSAGTFFKVVDGDDTLSREGLITLVGCLKDTAADLVASHYIKVSAENGVAPVPMRFENMEFNRLYRFEEIPQSGSLYFGIHSMTIRTSILKENHITLQEHTFYVDTELCLLPIPFVDTVQFIDATVYRYSVGNPSQSIDTRQFVARYDDHLRVVKRLVGYTNTCSCTKAHREYMYSVLQKLCFTQYMLAAFYDEDTKRGKERCRSFDSWLEKADKHLYCLLSSSIYIRFLRSTRFSMLPKGKIFKSQVKIFYNFVKPLIKKRKGLTYK